MQQFNVKVKLKTQMVLDLSFKASRDSETKDIRNAIYQVVEKLYHGTDFKIKYTIK